MRRIDAAIRAGMGGAGLAFVRGGAACPEGNVAAKAGRGGESGRWIHYPVPPHLSGAYEDAGFKAGAFPIAEELSRTVLSLPMGPHLTKEHAAQVVAETNNVSQGVEEIVKKRPPLSRPLSPNAGRRGRRIESLSNNWFSQQKLNLKKMLVTS